jgi:hypothetical protein
VQSTKVQTTVSKLAPSNGSASAPVATTLHEPTLGAAPSSARRSRQHVRARLADHQFADALAVVGQVQAVPGTDLERPTRGL